MANQLMIAVCDDIPADRVQISSMVQEQLQGIGAEHTVDAFADGRHLLQAIENGAQYQVLFLNVLLADMNGLDLAAKLKKEQKITVILVSANREYALQGYEVSAARYLSKPLDRDKVREALLYCCRLWLEQKAVLILTEHGYQKIPYTEIRYVEAFSRGTKFYLAGSTVESKMKFKDVEDALVKYKFAVCHRSYIVNLSQVRYIRRYEFELKDGGSVPIGKTRYGEIREQFLKYVED